MLSTSQIKNRKLISSGRVELRIFQVYTTHPAVLALEKCDQVVTDKSPSPGNEHLHHLPPLSVSTISLRLSQQENYPAAPRCALFSDQPTLAEDDLSQQKEAGSPSQGQRCRARLMSPTHPAQFLGRELLNFHP